ncbi:hypothetical protein V8E53_004176 [Lactarius tabidus]
MVDNVTILDQDVGVDLGEGGVGVIRLHTCINIASLLASLAVALRITAIIAFRSSVDCLSYVSGLSLSPFWAGAVALLIWTMHEPRHINSVQNCAFNAPQNCSTQATLFMSGPATHVSWMPVPLVTKTLDLHWALTSSVQELIASQNSAYMQLYEDNIKLMGHIESLEKAYKIIASAQGVSSFVAEEVIKDTTPKNPEDYPKIIYWRKCTHLDERNRLFEFAKSSQAGRKGCKRKNNKNGLSGTFSTLTARHAVLVQDEEDKEDNKGMGANKDKYSDDSANTQSNVDAEGDPDILPSPTRRSTRHPIVPSSSSSSDCNYNTPPLSVGSLSKPKPKLRQVQPAKSSNAPMPGQDSSPECSATPEAPLSPPAGQPMSAMTSHGGTAAPAESNMILCLCTCN